MHTVAQRMSTDPPFEPVAAQRQTQDDVGEEWSSKALLFVGGNEYAKRTVISTMQNKPRPG